MALGRILQGGVQEWHSSESTCLPPLWPGFDSQIRRGMCHRQMSFALLKPLYSNWHLISIGPQVICKISHEKTREIFSLYNDAKKNAISSEEFTL